MRTIISHFILILIVFLNSLFGQSTFELSIDSDKDQKIFSIIELNNSYLLSGYSYDSNDTLSFGYIVKLDNEGNITDELYLYDIYSNYIFNSHYFNKDIYLVGSKDFNYPDTISLWLLKLNEDLEIENESYFSLPQGYWYSYMNSIIDSDTNIVVAGYLTTQLENGTYHHDPGFYKISLNGDSINMKLMVNDIIPMRMVFDIQESRDSNNYYAYGSRFANIGDGGDRLLLNKEFDSITYVNCANGIYDFYSPMYLSDTSIVFYGHGNFNNGAEDEVAVSIAKDNMESLYYDHFSRDENMKEHPLMMNGIDINDNYIYVGGLSNWNPTNPFYSSHPSWFHIVKYDYELNRVWEKYFGGDAYYFPYSLKATSDGGCIIVGNRYDGEIQYVRDIYVVKVDSNGLITWTQSLNPQEYKVAVFPNPGKDYLQLHTELYPANLKLFNIKGQMVLEEEIRQNTTTIQTQSLSTGTYFWQLIKDGEIKENGKWINE